MGSSAGLFPHAAQAQKFEVGIGFGTMLYKGEVSDYYNPQLASPAIAALLKINFSHAVAFRVMLAGGRIRGDSRLNDNMIFNYLKTPYTFSHEVYEASMGIEYNFIDFRKYKSKQLGTPYLFGSIGVFTYTARRDENQDDPGIGFCIPFGVGYKYVLSRNWNIGAEFGARKVFTGYLDGVHKNFIPPEGVGQRGFKDQDDWYSLSTINITYTFYKTNCPLDVID
ncbi:MAG: DUF6089 family protein [Bacteroidota bacterium]